MTSRSYDFVCSSFGPTENDRIFQLWQMVAHSWQLNILKEYLSKDGGSIKSHRNVHVSVTVNTWFLKWLLFSLGNAMSQKVGCWKQNKTKKQLVVLKEFQAQPMVYHQVLQWSYLVWKVTVPYLVLEIVNCKTAFRILICSRISCYWLHPFSPLFFS